eukprot:gene10476-8439_t
MGALWGSWEWGPCGGPGYGGPVGVEKWCPVGGPGHGGPVLDVYSSVLPNYYVCSSVLPNYWDLKEVSLFLTGPNSLDPNVALGLYVKVGPSDWLYRGCVHNAHPSEVMPLQWPPTEQGCVQPGPGVVQLGVSIETGAEITQKEGSKLGEKQDFAKRVGMDLFRFMESFQTSATPEHIIIPANGLDKWFIKFQEKFRRDPDFLTRDKEKF